MAPGEGGGGGALTTVLGGHTAQVPGPSLKILTLFKTKKAISYTYFRPEKICMRGYKQANKSTSTVVPSNIAQVLLNIFLLGQIKIISWLASPPNH